VYAGSFIFTTGTSIVIVPTSLYLLFGGENMQNILIGSLVFSVLGTTLSFFIPESPRYLYERRKFDELRNNISFMARVNKSELDDEYLIDVEEELKNQPSPSQSESKLRKYKNNKGSLKPVNGLSETLLDESERESRNLLGSSFKIYFHGLSLILILL